MSQQVLAVEHKAQLTLEVFAKIIALPEVFVSEVLRLPVAIAPHMSCGVRFSYFLRSFS